MSYPTASGTWSNPPPPGTCHVDSEASSSASHDDKSITKHKKEHKTRVSKHHEKRRRSRSRSHHRRRHYRSSRSSSIERSRHSKRSHHSKRYSRSRSRSQSRKRYYKHRHSHSRRKSRSRSYSRSWSRDRRNRKSHTRSHSRSQKDSGSDNDESGPSQENTFKNDGSFLEMFKKLQQEQEVTDQPTEEASAVEPMKKQPLPVFGKRRGGRVLKTGLVVKPKSVTTIEEEEPKDAWSIYMKEVKRYKEACCDDDSKTRPLVK